MVLGMGIGLGVKTNFVVGLIIMFALFAFWAGEFGSTPVMRPLIIDTISV